MDTKKAILNTRPFQALFRAGEDLLRLALPYHQEIENSKSLYRNTDIVAPVDSDVWQLDKSLSIGSFMAMYAGLEAMVNCAFSDFKCREVNDLLDDYFIGILSKQRAKLERKEFIRWHLATRVFMLIPLCSNPIVDPRTIFDISSTEWNKFVEIIQVRHSFSHASGQKIQQEITKVGPKEWIANDDIPENFWPLTRAPRDHRILNYQTAFELNSIIVWVVDTLRCALPNQLDNKYGLQEIMKIQN